MKFFITVLTGFLFLAYVTKVNAAGYVLPYPSYMPGNKLYQARQIVEKVQEYWYFGDMAKVKYHMQLADKYLVEAKTLFEYNQYRLAIKALIKSDDHFTRAVLYERDVIFDKKDRGEQKELLRKSGEKHTEVLSLLNESLPAEAGWHEEKKEPETLYIKDAIKQSSQVRKYANR